MSDKNKSPDYEALFWKALAIVGTLASVAGFILALAK
jgi:hypothetical protein